MAYINRKYISGSIVVGQSQSNIFSLNEDSAVGLVISASTVTGTAMTFLGSIDGTNFYPVYDNTGTEVNISVGATARIVAFNISSFYPYNYLKCRLGTSASAVNQATYDTTLTLVTKNL